MNTRPGPVGGRQLFIYWHCAAEDLEAALAALRSWQSKCVSLTPELTAQVFVRIDAAAPRATVMETYALADASGILPALEQEIIADGDAATQHWRQGPRKLEAFVRRS